MIPALLAQTVHQALAYKPRAATAPAGHAAGGADKLSNSTTLTNPGAGPSIARDLGQLTTDTLSLLGLGDSGAAPGTPSQAAQAYAFSGGLGGR